MNDLYMRLNYDQYKGLEDQFWRIKEIIAVCDRGFQQHRIKVVDGLTLEFEGPLVNTLEAQIKDFQRLETTHKTVDGGYHKAFRLKVTETLVIEFQGPLIKPPLGDISDA